jgi:rare lipoprotein A
MKVKLDRTPSTGRMALIALAAGVLLAAPASAREHRARHSSHHRFHTEVGKASFYSRHAIGKKTASGERLTATGLTAASRSLPLGAKARVTNTDTGRSVKVTVTDRGPYVKGRVMDVSPKAADILGMKKDGVASVKVRPVELPKGRP